MKQRFGKYFYLLPLGLFVIAASQVIFRFINVSDFVKGSSMGFGIGLMIVALIKKPKPTVN